MKTAKGREFRTTDERISLISGCEDLKARLEDLKASLRRHVEHVIGLTDQTDHMGGVMFMVKDALSFAAVADLVCGWYGARGTSGEFVSPGLYEFTFIPDDARKDDIVEARSVGIIGLA